MSKTDSSLRLLAILRFAVPSNSSRTLNATQAYDVTSSGITLASATGTFLDKSVAVKATTPLPVVDLGLQLLIKITTAGPRGSDGSDGAGKQPKAEVLGSSATLSVSAEPVCIPISTCITTTATFRGTATADPLKSALSNKSKATNSNTVFYGGIPVGTGDYKKWQGKYAVLKINTVTGKGVLRIYDDA